MIKLLSSLAYRMVPWKNGGGATAEIAVDPEGAGWDEFNWRVAIADIRESGPFSSFPGVDRSILLIDAPRGTSMELRVDGRRIPLRLREFVDFEGEAKTEGVVFGERLTGRDAGVIRDFNVMSRRDVVRHRRGCHQLAPREIHRMGGTDTRVVYIAAGDGDLVNTSTPRALVTGDSVIASGDETLEIRGGEAGALLVWVVFSSVAA